MGKHRQETVCNSPWSSGSVWSGEVGTYQPVQRIGCGPAGKYRRGELYGRMYTDHGQMQADALRAGYLVPYYRRPLVFCSPLLSPATRRYLRRLGHAARIDALKRIVNHGPFAAHHVKWIEECVTTDYMDGEVAAWMAYIDEPDRRKREAAA